MVKEGGGAQATGADAQFGEAELLHYGFVDGGAVEDDIGAVGGQAGYRAAGGEGKAPEVFAVTGDVGEGEADGFDAFAVKADHAGGDAGEDGGGAAGADEQECLAVEGGEGGEEAGKDLGG